MTGLPRDQRRPDVQHGRVEARDRVEFVLRSPATSAAVAAAVKAARAEVRALGRRNHGGSVLVESRDGIVVVVVVYHLRGEPDPDLLRRVRDAGDAHARATARPSPAAAAAAKAREVLRNRRAADRDVED